MKVLHLSEHVPKRLGMQSLASSRRSPAALRHRQGRVPEHPMSDTLHDHVATTHTPGPDEPSPNLMLQIPGGGTYNACTPSGYRLELCRSVINRGAFP